MVFNCFAFDNFDFTKKKLNKKIKNSQVSEQDPDYKFVRNLNF